MSRYEEALAGLNREQRRAVEQIEGPVLVIAGPGTGKTQLLTTRIAHILSRTDILPENILCLTFTESAAATMRERLAGLIGQAAYNVNISTYHAFGADLIRRFPDYFTELADMRPADDLAVDGIFREIIAELPYSSPLKYAERYLGDIKSLISDAKRALLAPGDLVAAAKANDAFLAHANPHISAQLAGLARIDKKSVPLFEKILADMTNTPTETAGKVVPLGTLFAQELGAALEQVAESGKTNALTKWKNAWLAKNGQGRFVVDGQRTNQRLRAAATVYARYLQALAQRELFDYDDMILRAVGALEQNADLRFTLQERYLYLLLDEFQDTNGAQLRLVELLTDNPVNEGRPNVLAVGDDDQAIYAFQGANYSHMLQFQRLYRDVLLVPLTQNYRSHADILHTARGIAEQIEERLHHHFPQIEKTLTAENTTLPKEAIIERREAKSDVGQFAWVARRIKKLIKQGMPANEIAVLAPQHKYLVPLVPFLHQQGVPVRYEKRENVLDDPLINQLLRMSELVLALNVGKHALANSLWAEVLSFEFWHLPTSLIWQLSWQANDDRENWSEVLLQRAELKPIVLFFIRLSFMATSETLETMLDYLIGSKDLDLQEPGLEDFTSPFYEYYFAPTTNWLESGDDPSERPATSLGKFWNLLTNLTVLRSRLHGYKQDDTMPLLLPDFIGFVEAHRAAEIKILNTNPYQEAAEAVQLMTAFKAKGQEFGAVFVLSLSDDAWGNRARSAGNRLSLPQNLQFIRYAGATTDERLRLFYVALTRAKTQLYLLSYLSNFAGKVTNRLQYLNETTDESGVLRSPLLPAAHQQVLSAEENNAAAPTTELAAYWQQRHEAALDQTDLQHLLHERLARFQLSPTHVCDFVDVANCGPRAFFMKTILRFPYAPTPELQFGNAMHETLEWLHRSAATHGAVPVPKAAYAAFEQKLRTKRLNEQLTEQLIERGKLALTAYLQQKAATILAPGQSEYSFRNEGVFIGDAHLAGNIDKLIVDKDDKTITIIDYKTGRSHTRWDREIKLHKYRWQLYIYKLLVEGSHTFAGYTVKDAYLEFVEPDDDGIVQELHVRFSAEDEAHIKQLIPVIWQRIQTLNLPDISRYSSDLSGIETFERWLLSQS
jgi:DNA helicase II / ATP-dependent DNA helicase PcrA